MYVTVGNCDGMVNGRRYFQCPQDYGLFVRASRIRFIPLKRWQEFFSVYKCYVFSRIKTILLLCQIPDYLSSEIILATNHM